MKNILSKASLVGSAAVLLAIAAAPLHTKEPKLKVEDVIARHLASIGSPENRAAVKTRVVTGSAQVTFRLGSAGQLGGTLHILSQGMNVRIGMNFQNPEYPGEQYAFDGQELSVGWISPGQRSPLSVFVYQYTVLIKEGLLGGTLTTAWPLLDVKARNPKLNYDGLKKVENRNLHRVKYRAKKGAGDIQVALYFDPETFRHVLSEYRLVVPAMMASTPSASAGQSDTRYKLTEEFGDFRVVDGLTLAHSCKMIFTIEGGRSTNITEYLMVADQISHNQELDSKFFKM